MTDDLTLLREAVGNAGARFAATFADDRPLIYEALLAAEDHRGHLHRGIDWISIGRSVILAFCEGRICAVSTIEQQLVRTVIPRTRRDLPTKVGEMILARGLAGMFPKETIWAAYLELAFYGGRAGYHVVRAQYLPSGGELAPLDASRIVACLKYPIRRRETLHSQTIRDLRAAYIQDVLNSGMQSIRKRIVARSRACWRRLTSTLSRARATDRSSP